MCAAVDIPFKDLSGNDVFEYVSALETIRTAVEQSTPACIEIHLAALNNHSGPTPGWPTDPRYISIDDGLVVEETLNDPVFVLQQKMGSKLLDDLAVQVLAEEWRR